MACVLTSPYTYRSAEEMAAIGAIRKAGYVPVEDALFHYYEAKFRNMRPSSGWVEIRDRVRKEGSKGSIQWGLRLKATQLELYQAVCDGELQLLAWPAEVIDDQLVIQTTAKRPARVPVRIIKRLYPLNGGLPERTLGLSPTITCAPAEEDPEVDLSPDGVPVFSEREFLRWLARERAKLHWPSQEAFISHVEMHRLRKSAIAKPFIRDAVESKAWAWYQPIAQLTRLVRVGVAERGWGSISTDVVTATLDELYIATGDSAFWTPGFGMRNPELRGIDEPNQRLKTPIPPCTFV